TATTNRRGETGLPDGSPFRMHLGPAELAEAAQRIDRIFGADDVEVVLLNPSASNPHTRESGREKAVDNRLCLNDYESLVVSLLEEFPHRRVLIGSALKPGD